MARAKKVSVLWIIFIMMLLTSIIVRTESLGDDGNPINDSIASSDVATDTNPAADTNSSQTSPDQETVLPDETPILSSDLNETDYQNSTIQENNLSSDASMSSGLNDTNTPENTTLEDNNTSQNLDNRVLSELNETRQDTQNSSLQNSSSKNSNSENSGGNSFDLDAQYTGLENLTGNFTEENNSALNQENSSNLPENGPLTCSSQDGKMGLIANASKCQSITFSANEEEINNSTTIWINISSSEPIEEPSTFYTNIVEAKRENIKIYWENENNETVDITNNAGFEVNFNDINNNSLIDRVSWKVPHLSDQYFKIEVNSITIGDSPSLEITVIKPINNSIIKNPAEFNFSINYSNPGNIICTLGINGEDFNLPNSSIIKNLSNGEYNWALKCADNVNWSINKTVYGNFKVNSTFLFSMPEGDIYTSGENITLNLCSETGNLALTIKRPDNSIVNYELDGNCSQNFVLNNSVLTKRGIYTINATSYYYAKPVSIIKNFSVTSITLISNKKTIIGNESVTFVINISSPEEILGYIFYFNDSASDGGINLGHEFKKSLTHTYSRSGNYTPQLNVFLVGRDKQIMIEGERIEVKKINNSDDEPPLVVLLSPEIDEEIDSTTITFSYNATDNVKLSNCTFELYNRSSSFGSLIYNTTKKNPTNGQKIEIGMKDFTEGDYSWYVTCFDNSSNWREKSRDFSVDFANSSSSVASSTTTQTSNENSKEVQKIDLLISRINDFYVKENTFLIEEKEALADLKIHDTLDYYKKALMQDKKDLESNLATMDSSTRETRKQEILAEVERIRKDIITDIKIVGKEEYVKNSPTQNLEEIIKTYVNESGSPLSERDLQDITKLNLELQKDLSVTTVTKQLELIYENETRKITLVTKKSTIKNDSSDTLLEFIPAETIDGGTLTFLTENEAIKENQLFEISPVSQDQKIAYYITGIIPPKEIEKTDTLLFREDFLKGGTKITGYYLLNLMPEIKTPYFYLFIILAIIIFYFVIVGRTQIKVNGWKKQENTKEVFKLIKKISENLKEKDLEEAKKNYSSLQIFYPLIPSECKRYLYRKIENIVLSIDKKDAANLIKEYLICKRENRNEDASRVYTKLQEIYKRLPKKYKERAYKKVFSNN